jgi:hypothetical protein
MAHPLANIAFEIALLVAIGAIIVTVSAYCDKIIAAIKRSPPPNIYALTGAEADEIERQMARLDKIRSNGL